jgi:hypothetical protein
VNKWHVEAMLSEITKDEDSRVLSAVVFSDSFHAQRFKLWINPNAQIPLLPESIAELRALFGADDIRLP